MREAASVRCDGGGARVALGRGVAIVQSSEASLAWARGGGSGGRGGWRGRARRRHRAEQRGLVGVGARRKERRRGWRVADEETGLGELQQGRRVRAWRRHGGRSSEASLA
jgi:hypothetical protein